MKRRHRWIRGDWQIARWLFARAPSFGRESPKNPLSALSRWKIFDNLRRSLTPLAMASLFLLSWMILPQPWLWTLAVTAAIGVPLLLASLCWRESAGPAIFYFVEDSSDLCPPDNAGRDSRSDECELSESSTSRDLVSVSAGESGHEQHSETGPLKGHCRCQIDPGHMRHLENPTEEGVSGP